MINCECEHKRIEHEGSKNLSDKGVHNCKIQGCKCKKFKIDEYGKKQKEHILLKCIIRGIIIIGICGIGFGIYYHATDSIFSEFEKQYEIKEKFTIYDKYTNGTFVPEFKNNDNSKTTLTDGIKGEFIGIGALIFIYGGLIICTIFLSSIYERDYKELMKE